MVTYTKLGPFQDGTGTPPVLPVGAPPINAAFLNGVETALLALTSSSSSVVSTVTGWFHVNSYGAVGDGSTDDRAAIQAAITAANAAYTSTGARQIVYFPALTFVVGAVNYLRDDGTTYGAVSLMLYDGVTLYGPGTIKVKSGAYGSGALYGCIRSKSGGLSTAGIDMLTIDGNTAGNTASTQCSNVLLNVTADVTISNTRQLNANGNGILMTGSSGGPATNLRAVNNYVVNCTSIGIQMSQFNGIDIDGNFVAHCTDNGIDIYGDNGTTSSTGTNFRITNNRVLQCLVGIFPETVAYGIVANNQLSQNTSAGIHVNRINGAPTGVVIEGNHCTGNPSGIYITGDMSPGSVYIRGNTVTSATTAAIQLGGGGAALSYIYIADNFLDTASLNATPLILIASGTTTWSQSTIRRTLTKNTSHSYDVVNYATTTAGTVSYDASNS